MKILKAVLAALVISAIILFPYKKNDALNCSAEYPLMNFVIVLDAGHGGEDGGAIGVSTLVREKDINLQITEKIRTLFLSAGATVVLTRSDGNALCSGKYSKLADMRARTAIINQANPYIVISVHCNSFPQDKNSKGAQMFYYPGSDSGERLAGCIQASLRNNVDETNSREAKSEDFYMLRQGNSTNVMIECGFLSCPDEEKLLCDDAYQSLIAYSVFDGTSAYITSLNYK